MLDLVPSCTGTRNIRVRESPLSLAPLVVRLITSLTNRHRWLWKTPALETVSGCGLRESCIWAWSLSYILQSGLWEKFSYELYFRQEISQLTKSCLESRLKIWCTVSRRPNWSTAFSRLTIRLFSSSKRGVIFSVQTDHYGYQSVICSKNIKIFQLVAFSFVSHLWASRLWPSRLSFRALYVVCLQGLNVKCE